MLLMASEVGPKEVGKTGVFLADSGSTLSLLLFSTTGGVPDRNVTDEAVWLSADPQTVEVDAGRLTARQPGETRIFARWAETEVDVSVRVIPDQEAAILDFWFSAGPQLVTHSMDTIAVEVEGELENGRVTGVTNRVLWESSDPDVVTVDSTGSLVPRSEGKATITASTPDLIRTIECIVALPQVSGAKLPADLGGLVTNGEATVYLQPDTLAEDVGVTISDPIPEPFLPAAVPVGEEYLSGVTIHASGQKTFTQPLRVTLPITGGADGQLVRVLMHDKYSDTWMPSTWGIVEGDRIRFHTTHLSTFAAVRADGELKRLAEMYKPQLVISENDISPMSFENLLKIAHLEYMGEPITAPWTVSDLMGRYDSRDYALRLDDEVLDYFKHGLFEGEVNSWNIKQYRASAPPPPQSQAQKLAFVNKDPTVYYSVQLEDEALVIQYWFLYAASGAPYYLAILPPYYLEHEGDIEMFQVVLDVSEGAPRPLAATASQHYYGEGRPWCDVKKVPDTSNAILYVAEAGHATYFDRSFETSAGNPDEYKASLGAEGFIWKLGTPWGGDKTPLINSSMSRVLTEYALTYLDPSSGVTGALLEWNGEIGEGIPAIRYRYPGTKAHPDTTERLNMYGNPIDFHCAYNFSSRNAIEAYAEIRPNPPRIPIVQRFETVIEVGGHLLGLQDYLSRSLGENCGNVQALLDRVDSVPGYNQAQPELLAEFLLNKGDFAQYLWNLDVPLIPQNVRVRSGLGEVTVEWAPIGGGREYRAYWSFDEHIDPESDSYVSCSSSSVTITSLPNGSRLWFGVAEVRGGRMGEVSKAIAAVPGFSAPDGVSAWPGDGSVSVAWDSVANASGYRVYYSRLPFTDTADAVWGFTARPSMTISGLENDAYYYFRVVAIQDGLVRSALSSEAKAVPFSDAGAGLERVYVSTRFVALRLWDYALIDGDQIDVILGGEEVLSDYILEGPSSPVEIILALQSGANTIRIHADNEGAYSPNTAAVSVTSVVDGEEVQEYSLDTDGTAEFLIIAP